MRLRDHAHELTSHLHESGPWSPCCTFKLRHAHGLHGVCTRDLEQDFPTDKFSFTKILSIFCKENSLEKGKCMHTLAVFLGLDFDAFVATAILSLYGKCGLLDDAHKTFERLHDKDVISWNAIISADVKHGREADCLHLWNEMHQNCVLADKFTFVSMLSACAALEDIRAGQHIHARLVIDGRRHEVILDTALVHMYSKCKNINHARSVFDEMEHHDMISWNTMISGYAQLGCVEHAFHLFHEMSCKGMVPNMVSFIVILDACAALPDGRILHSWLIEVGFKVDVVLGSALLNMYCTYSCLNEAQKVFDSLSERNLITWNSLIAGYTAENRSEEALELFNTMQDEGINPDRITWNTILDACAGLGSLAKGEYMYNRIVTVGLEYDNSVVASVMKFYGNFGSADILQVLFRRVPQKDFLLWNSIIMVNAQHGLLSESCELLHEMHESGVVPDCQMLVDLLCACAKQAAFSEGRYLHLVAILLAVDTDSLVTNALINMYGDCSSLEDAWCLFERVNKQAGIYLTSIIGAYAHSGNHAHAIYLYAKMCRDNAPFDKVTSIKLLNCCSIQEYLTEGQNMHTDITMRGFDLDIMVANALICMYGKCGALVNAQRVFEATENRDVVSWNTMITAYAQHDKLTEVFKCLYRMEKEGVAPDEVTYASMLSACTWKDTCLGVTLVHDCVVCGGFEAVPATVVSLLHFYAKLGTLDDAHYLFDKLLIRNAVAWNAMITGYTQRGRTAEALQLFVQMQNEGVLAEKASYVCTFNTCSDSNSLLCGKHLHACIISLGFSQDILVNTALVSLYGRCCSLEDACTLFYKMPEKDEVSWSAFIRALSEIGFHAKALQHFERMLEEALLPNIATFLNFLHACTECRALTDGLKLHARLLCSSYVSDIGVTNAILNMYGESGRIVDLERFFCEMQEHDAVSCNIMIKSYAHSHRLQEALRTFLHMGLEGLLPDMVTLAGIFEVCGSLDAYFQGKLVQISAIYSGISHIAVNNAAITMYSKCGHLQEALTAFNHILEKNIASWNSIISAVCYWEDDRIALEMFVTMLSEVTPDAMTFATVLCACRGKEALAGGRLLHYFITSLGLEQEVMIGNSLISMYGRCGSSTEADGVFERISVKNTATWNAMLTSDVLLGATNFHPIEDMERNGASPNEITFYRALDFCVNNNAASRGRHLHMHILLCGFELDVNIVTSLVNLYGKCGMLKDAISVFKNATTKNFFTWTAMIAACSCYGLGEEALLLLQQMDHKGLMVDNVTLLSILSACGHSGSLDSGRHFFFEMLQCNMAELEHFNCVVDLSSRMGQMAVAENMIWSMPFQPTAMTWTVLVGACQTVGDFDSASRAVAHLTELDGQNIAGNLKERIIH